MRQSKLPVILAFVTIVSAIGGTVADARAGGFERASLVAGGDKAPTPPDAVPVNGDPDVPSGIKSVGEAPSSDGQRRRVPLEFGDLPGIRRAWMSWVMRLWLAR